ncbi:MAG: hypothetical protein M1830_005357 [Pleopsidium flavum]|nr:MAG: hypothetical protein M1830_005357 [Pleopsidium flavum]
MLFAAIIDTGLIPFFVFTALMSRTEYTEPSDIQGRWQTLFGDDLATYKIIYSTFLFSVVNGGLHLISLLLSLYLAVIFRKIAKLPPDMNPLEDNLTSRHKRNKSSISEKRVSQATTVFTSPNSKRASAVDDPLIAPPRTIPFMHTRTESTDSLSGQTFPNSRSRADLPSQLYQQQPSVQSSRIDVAQPPAQYSRSKDDSIYCQTERLPPPNLPSRPSSIVQPSKNSLLNDNWFTYPSSSAENSPPDHDESVLSARSPSAVSSLKDWEPRRTNQDYLPLQQTFVDDAVVLHPLEMHPPTPPPQRQQYQQDRALTPGNGNRPIMGRRPSSFVGAGKGRYYGDLNATTRAKEMGTFVDLPLERGGGRVISNSGADYRNGYGGARRDVSGKVAEEGRAGAGGGWARWRKVSGV